MKKVLITGIGGQDGSYLTELLLTKGCEVYGIERNSDSRISREVRKTFIEDIQNLSLVFRILEEVSPDEVYHLAAQSSIPTSINFPEETIRENVGGISNILEAIKQKAPRAKFYFAGSSEMFGKPLETPQTEKTQFNPRNAYGSSKVSGFHLTKDYRERFGIFSCTGITYNHESPRRREEFVTRKITSGLAKIRKGVLKQFSLGNLDAKRDWGFAGDYVEAMWLMLQQDIPDDYIIATGETHSVREFVEIAAKELEMNLEWMGEGINEVGIDKNTGKEIVSVDPKFFRPAEVDLLLGDASKARQKLGWKPKVRFGELVKMMVEEDMKVIN
jgi:GDPmannose 4,6-dehydratase